MSSPYVGEIRMFGGNFAPSGWAFCNGQTVPISENDTLFNLIGTIYGGDGNETFNLPNLSGRMPFHAGTLGPVTLQVGETGGTEQVTLTSQQIPAHSHGLIASPQTAVEFEPSNRTQPASPSALIYNNLTPLGQMSPLMVASTGGSQPHENMPPFLTVSFIISLFGIFPTQT